MKTTTTTSLLATVSVLILAGAAQAQDAPPADDQQATNIGEIVVTAQRRSEALKDVPLTIVARTGEDLERAGVTDTRGLELVTPGLKMQRSGAYTQPAIRGVTSVSTAPSTDPNVALYVDGVYQPNQSANTFDLPDVAQVEVAKGPQGTLFGRNATGGAIQITTRRPSFTPTGLISAGYGRFNDRILKGFYSGPLIEDRLAFSVSAFGERSDGWYHDLTQGGRTVGEMSSGVVRGKLLFEPAEGWSFTLTGTHSERDDPSTFYGPAYRGNTVARAATPLLATGAYEISNNAPGIMDVQSNSLSLTSRIDIGAATLSTVTAWQKSDSHLGFDGDFTPLSFFYTDLIQPDENFIQEVNFASDPTARFRYVAGAFYYRDDTGYDPIIAGLAGGVLSISRSEANTRAAAAYIDATYELTDRLTIIGGLRYSWEKKSLAGVRSLTAPLAFISDASWDSVTPRLSVRYALTDETNVYASYNEGFKSGAYNVSGLAATPVEPEEIKAYEVGVKTSRSGVSASLSAFYYRYANQQVQAQSGTFNVLQNAAASDIYGVDADASVRITPDLRLVAGVAYLDATYDAFPGATILVPVASGGNASAFRDLTGYRMNRAPEWTATLTADYGRTFAVGEFTLSGTVYYSSSFGIEPSNRIVQPDYALVSARASFAPSAFPGVRMSVWGRNLTDEAVIQSNFISNFGDGVFYDRPTTYGLAIEYSF